MLCSLCENIDLPPLFTPYPGGVPQQWELHDVNLGQLESVFKRTKVCELCAFVAEKLEESYGKNGFYYKDLPKLRTDNRLFCDLVWNSKGRLSFLPEESSDRKTSLPLYSLSIAIIYRGDGYALPTTFRTVMDNALQPAVWPVPHLIPACDEKRDERNDMGSARLRSSKFQPSVSRHWLRVCEDLHPDCLWNGPKSSLFLRFLDVKDRCIKQVSFSQTNRPPYVALSYQWGRNAQRLVMTKGNFEHLCKSGSINLSQLPQTIFDATEVVLQLGERLLWIDALCIIQDDEEDLKAQLPKMGEIYARSVLTIVDGAGNDANHGLYGISRARGDQRVFGPLKIGALVTPCNPRSALFDGANRVLRARLDHYLASSRWNQRGWTFQERILSRRCLVFMHEQAHWECHCASWCEDNCLDTALHIRCAWTDRLGNVVPLFVRTKDFPPGTTFLNWEDADRWTKLVRDYTGRNLTFQKDASRAFSGLTQILSSLSGTEFFHGLPIPAFDQSLWWHLREPEASFFRSEAGAPTWSWLAWTGQVDLKRKAFWERNIDMPSKEITCYWKRLDNAGQGRLARVCNVQQAEHRGLEESSIVSDTDIDHAMWSSLKIRFHIIFWAHVIRMDVRWPPFESSERDARLVNSLGQVIGYMVSGPEPVVGHHAFVLVQRLPAMESVRENWRANFGDFVPEDHIEGIPNDSAAAEQYHLLRVSWHNGFARREGTAYATAPGWEKARPKRELIVME